MIVYPFVGSPSWSSIVILTSALEGEGLKDRKRTAETLRRKLRLIVAYCSWQLKTS